jgi:rhamnosyltransferase
MIDNTISNKDICAITITFNPDADFLSRVNILLKQVNEIVIVDNHSERLITETLQDLTNHPDIHLIINEANLGVATALNQGISHAKNLGYEWVVLLDQDTTPSRYMIEALVQAFNHLYEKGNVAIIGANYTNDRNTLFNKYISDISYLLESKKTVITSGSLLSITAFNTIGCFRDNFFIDHVDDEFCLRARSKGFNIYRTKEPLMLHSIGSISTHVLIKRSTGTSNHSAIRRYYMYRNHTALIIEYFFREPKWVFRTAYSRFKSLILLSLFEKDKINKLRAAFLGIGDGIVGNFNNNRINSLGNAK